MTQSKRNLHCLTELTELREPDKCSTIIFLSHLEAVPGTPRAARELPGRPAVVHTVIASTVQTTGEASDNRSYNPAFYPASGYGKSDIQSDIRL